MDLKDLRPVGQLAHNYGVKAIVYGAPGSAKSPISLTSPKPILLITEPGTMSMKGSNIPAYEAFTGDRIDAFFQWWFSSNETKQFDTLVVDSSSQLAEIFLQDALKTNKHGLKAFGDMAQDVMEHFRKLFFMKEKHIYLIAKEGSTDGMRRPFYSGKILNVEIPHLFDLILHLGIHNIPGPGGGQHLSFQCRQTIDILARDRSGRLNDYEEPHFGKLVQKVMQG